MKLRVREAILVEGRYDKNTLAQVVDALIIPADGFSIFRNKEKIRYLRRIAEERGLIILTDSDGAGFLIRSHLKGQLPEQKLKQAYVPEISGKEPRKRAPGKEGLLGVEGMRKDVLIAALRSCGATFEHSQPQTVGKDPITKADLMRLGLAGGEGSAALRLQLQQKLDLPSKMTANALLQALNLLYSKAELENAIAGIKEKKGVK